MTTHEDLLAELDALLLEAPVDVGELIDELAEIRRVHRDDRATERPGAQERWDR